jgi:hypothetical protein
MLGDLISDGKGKRIVRRVVSSDPVKVEVSFEETGTLLGYPSSGFGTYWAVMQENGAIYGEGAGVMATADGDVASWKASARGKIGPGGAVSYRGAIFFQTKSEKLARLNGAPGVFEHESSADGVTDSKIWEWK